MPVKTRDYRYPRSPAKEGHSPGRRVRGRKFGAALGLLSLTLALAGCRTAGYCLREVPEAMRADVVRYALDKQLSSPRELPYDERELAEKRGRPAAALSEAEAAQIRPWAMRYSHCIRDE